MNFAIGRTGFRLTAFANTRENRIGVQLIIHKGEVELYYNLLRQEKTAIEAELGETLEWRERPNRKSSYIMLQNRHTDPTDRDQWPQQHVWLHQKLEAFSRCFAPRIQELDAAAYMPVDEG